MSKNKTSMNNFLEQWVVHDGKPITARLLSLVQKCHISAAHESMAAFYDEMSKRDQESIPFTSWIVKGPLKAEIVANTDSQTSIDPMDLDEDDARKTPLIREALLLVTQEKLKEVEAKFESISVRQVYSFSPRLSTKHTDAHKIAAISQLTTIQHDLHSNEEYIDAWESSERGAEMGTIQSAEKWEDSGKPNLPQNGAGPSKSSATAPPVKKEIAKEIKKEEKKDNSKESKKAEGLNFAKAKSTPKSKRKLVESDDEEEPTKQAAPIDEDEDDDNDAGPIGYSTEKTKAEVVEASKSGKAARKRADAGDKVTTDEEKRRQKQELIDMMDEDEAGDADPPAIETGQTTSTSMMQGTADGAEERKEIQKPSDTSATKRRVRKQRKVIKKVKTKDSKGYTKTQDVEEYESYSSYESDTPAVVPKAAKAASKGGAAAAAPQKEAPAMARTNSGSGTNNRKGASGAAGGGGQRKLASFFTKK